MADTRTMRSVLVLSLAIVFRTTMVSGGEETSEELKPGRYERTIEHDGRTRSYILYLPAAFKTGKPLPLVLLLHGGGGNAAQAFRGYQLDKKAESAGFILVVPNGTGRFRNILLTWNVGFGFGYAQENRVDDVGFIKKLVSSLRKELKVDPKRIYATGISNGGIMCHWLAAELGETFAAIAPVVATLGGKRPGEEELHIPPDPKHPVSVIAFNGMKDDHVPFEGGLQRKSVGPPRYMLSVDKTLQFWIKTNQCEHKAVVQEAPTKKFTRSVYARAKNNTKVVLYAIHNQGHAWPGATAFRKTADKPTQLISANDLMWEFFEKHPKGEKQQDKPVPPAQK